MKRCIKILFVITISPLLVSSVHDSKGLLIPARLVIYVYTGSRTFKLLVA